MAEMLTIDGSQGEGGGQILRTSMALAGITGRAIRIHSIRAKRSKPGLMRQHLTAVRAAAEVCGGGGGGTLIGAELGAQEIAFEPGEIKGGTYRFATGSAGSTMLVMQTVLPMLLCAREESEVVVEGGTHNPHAPPFDFVAEAFLPLVRRMGAEIEIRQERYGFYPAGGGRVVLSVKPWANRTRLEIPARDREVPVEKSALAVVADLPGEIAVRELAVVKQMLNVEESNARIFQAGPGQGPGNVLMVKLAWKGAGMTEVFTGLGERGRTAESVATEVCREVRQYLTSQAYVGEHLADQLIVPMALGLGGQFVTSVATEHLRTNLNVVSMFLPIQSKIEDIRRGVRVTVERM